MRGDPDVPAVVKPRGQAKKPVNARILTRLQGQVNVGKGQVTRRVLGADWQFSIASRTFNTRALSIQQVSHFGLNLRREK